MPPSSPSLTFASEQKSSPAPSSYRRPMSRRESATIFLAGIMAGVPGAMMSMPHPAEGALLAAVPTMAMVTIVSIISRLPRRKSL